MKLSTKLILFFTSTLLFITFVSCVLLYLGSLNMAASQVAKRIESVLSTVDVASLQKPEVAQKNIEEIKGTQADFSNLQIIQVGQQPTVVSAYDSAEVGSKISDETTLGYITKSVRERRGTGSLFAEEINMVVPILKGNEEIQYVGHVTIKFQSVQDAAIRSVGYMLIAFAIIMVIMIGLVGFVSTRMLKRPLNRLIDSANQIASGDLNIQFGKEIKSKDEIGQLSRAFSNMSENLKLLIGKISDSAQQVAASAQELTAGADQTSQASRHIVETVQQVAVGSERQVSSVEDSAHVINEMSTGVQKISENANSVSSTAKFASEVAAEGNEAIRTVMKQMNSINSTVHGLHEMIKRLGERSQEIGQIVQVITGIAEQTNLLALNAAIEAARAGENGRGFSVVADEVRKLAVQSASSGQQITELVETIQDETNIAILSMETGTKEVSEGISVVNSAGESFRHIQDAIDEVVEQIHSVSAAVNQMSAGADKVVQSIQMIAEVAEETAGNTQLVSASTQEQLASMNEIADASLALNEMAEELQSLVTEFKM